MPAPLRVLFHGQFGLFVGGNTLTLTGTWMQRIASGWLVWHWTGSVFWLGMLAVGDLLPVVVIGPLAGVAADRWDRLKQNKIAQVLSAFLALALAVLLLFDRLNITSLLILATLQGTLVAAVQPARLAMIQEMVPREDMSAAVAINSVNVNLARLLGPAVAGLMIVYLDIIWVFVLNALFTLLFVVILGQLKLVPRVIHPTQSNFLTLMREGFTYALRTPAMRVVLCALLVGGIAVRSMLELLPAVAAQTFLDTTTGLAVLTGAAAVGAIVSGLTARSGQSLNSILLWWALGAIAACALTSAPYAFLAVAAATILGASITRGMVGTQTIVQLATPDALRGRVLSIHGLIARGSPALGALPIGYAADIIGLPSTVMVASSLLLVITAALLIGGRSVQLHL
ncbi:MFS transporter [Pseudomonas karstica]|uniref:MFS transporter n=1 Tax=Pseudomonas karstica TaxID=1055468 RepID=UPI001C499858|nr:MFS transporter [Pseudomonas karstica]